jgi:hypothetical protein
MVISKIVNGSHLYVYKLVQVVTVVTKKDLRRSKISRTLPAQIMPSNNDSAWSEVEFK